MKHLSPKQIAIYLKTVPQWARRAKTIHREFEFKGFTDAIDFVNRVARAAEKNDHHPDIDIRYNQVKLALVTHDSGGITQKDIDLATRIDGVSAGTK